MIGFAGNLSPIQGVELLIDAVRKDPSNRTACWIIGTGAQEGRLRKRAEGLGRRVRFFGGVTREESDRLQQACQILAAPYRREPYLRASAGGALSSKVLAYLANDRPILITDLPAYAWIEKIGAGQLCPTDDAAGFWQAISNWQRRWEESGRRLTGWPWDSPGPGRRFVASDRTWDDAAARVEEILDQIARTE